MKDFLYSIGIVLRRTYDENINDYKGRVVKLLAKNIKLTNKIQELEEAQTSSKREIKCLKQSIKDITKKYRKLDELDYEYKYNSQKMGIWSASVKEKAKNTCDVCRFVGHKSELEAHHLYPKHIHVSMMYLVDNGVCLCKKCHFDLHQEQPTDEMTHLKYLEFKEKRQK